MLSSRLVTRALLVRLGPFSLVQPRMLAMHTQHSMSRERVGRYVRCNCTIFVTEINKSFNRENTSFSTTLLTTKQSSRESDVAGHAHGVPESLTKSWSFEPDSSIRDLSVTVNDDSQVQCNEA